MTTFQSKCEPYWPDDYKSALTFGDISVSASIKKEASHYTIRHLTLTKVLLRNKTQNFILKKFVIFK